MRVRVLGSAAGGAFPQWNCGCDNCRAVREGRPGFLPRTEDSLAVSGDGARYVLVNASPGVGEQLRRTRELWPRDVRSTPIGAIVLTNGDLDHTLGLFSLRESQPLAIYATRTVREGLERNAILKTLARFPGHTVFRDLVLGEETTIADAGGAPLGLTMKAVAAPGKRALHLEDSTEPSAEDNVALAFSTPANARLVYAATYGKTGEFLREAEGAGAAFFDGTFYSEHEMASRGCGEKPAASMAHLPVSEALAALEAVRCGRKIFTHVNNTNPMLDPESAAAREVRSRGFEIAYDGMEIDL